MEENKKQLNIPLFSTTFRNGEVHEGMTLRDHFSVHEKAILSSLFWNNQSFQKTIIEQAKEEKKKPEVLMCEMAYSSADLMLEQREL